MTRFLTATAAMAITATPLLLLASEPPPAMIGADRPLLLKRMVVTATALPDLTSAR